MASKRRSLVRRNFTRLIPKSAINYPERRETPAGVSDDTVQDTDDIADQATRLEAAVKLSDDTADQDTGQEAAVYVPDDIAERATRLGKAVKAFGEKFSQHNDDIADQDTRLELAVKASTGRIPQTETDIADRDTIRMPAPAVTERVEITTEGTGESAACAITPTLPLVATRRPQSRAAPVTPVGGSLVKPRARGRKRLPLWLAACSILTIIAVVFIGQGNGTTGAWLADALRAVVGPTITANIESWYLGLSNTSTQVQYQLGGKKVAAPWQKPSGTVVPTPTPTPPAWSTLKPMTLSLIPPVISPALSDEGVWTTLKSAPAPYGYLPLDAKAYIRPDPAHPYAIVTMLKFDPRFTLLHIVGGTIEPGGPRGVHGPGIIPASDAKSAALLAAFNGGFKYADGRYGLMTNGVIYVPPQAGAATIAITKQGRLVLGAWGNNLLLNSQDSDLAAWRQNGALLINNGEINPLTQDGAAWGGTVLNSAYTWRSAIGLTADGALVYAAGNALTAATLGAAMKDAGVVTAMQTDINPFWVRAFLYNRTQKGAISVEKLNPQMQGTGYEYLYGTQRDFFYLTDFAPATPPTE